VTEILAIFKDFTPGTYGIWSLVLMGLAYALREWRETRKLSAEDRLARREGYAKQVEGLQKENRELRADLAAVEERHDNYRRLCHAETDQLRDQVVHLENRMSGLLRKLADVAVRAARGDVDKETAALILQLVADATAPIMQMPSRLKPDKGQSHDDHG
jgi:hypothetical protein